MIAIFCIAVILICGIRFGAKFDDCNSGRGGGFFVFTDLLLIVWAVGVLGNSIAW